MGKSFKKSKQSTERKNKALNTIVLTEDDAIFGRITKELGFGRYKIQVPDAKGNSTEANAAVVARTIAYPHMGDIIVVGRNESGKHITYEILGALDRKTITKLQEAKRFPNFLFNEDDELGDDLFDRSEPAPTEEETTKPKLEKGNKPVKKDKMTVNMDDDDDDIDVDNI